MESRMIVAGFGGQGVMMIGQLVCYTAIANGKQALFLPHYGPEQRGGTANCTVTISEEEIGAPIVRQIDVLIAMNQPSLDKFWMRVKPDGIILVNSVLCTKLPDTTVNIVSIPVDSEAEKLGSKKVANIIMLAAYARSTNTFTEEEIRDVVLEKLGKKPEYLEINRQAVRVGAQLGQSLAQGLGNGK